MTELEKAARQALVARYFVQYQGSPIEEVDEAKFDATPEDDRFKLYEAPAQQEPTVEDNSQNWRGMDGTTAYWLIQRHADGWADVGKMMSEWLEANQTPPAQQEPVAWMNPDDLEKMKRFGRGSVAWATPTDFCTQPVYTRPQAREPLTDEQIYDMYNEPRSDAEMLEFARAIEAAHGIKGDA